MTRDLIVAVAFMLAVPFAVLPCGAASCTLLTDAEGGTGAWTKQTRWKDGAMPQAGDDINIRASVTVTDAEMPVLMRAAYAVTRGTATVLTLDLDNDYEVATALAGDGAVVRKGSGKLVFRSSKSNMVGGFAFEAGTVVLPPNASQMCRIVVRGGRVEMAEDFTDAASRPLPPLEIASPGVVCLPRSGSLTVRGISGDGTFVVHPEADTTKAQQLVLVGTEDGRAFTFSGTVPENLAFTLSGGNQRLLKPSGESRRDFRLQRGIMGVASFGEGSEAGSFGTSRVWMQGHGDAAHRDVARGIVYNDVANERAFDALEPGQVALDATGVYFEERYAPGKLFTAYVDNTTARWPLGTALVFRLPSEATVCGYDLVSGWYEDTKEKPFKWTVTDWTLEGSPDGRAWRTLDAKSGYLTCRAGKNYWLSDARPYDEASTGFPIASEDGRCVKGQTLGTVAVATGATLEVRGSPAATGLSVGVDWAGTFRGVDFAQTGTLTVKVPIDAGRAFTIPCSFEDCAGTENLKNWTLSFDGDPGSTWALARADASGLLFAKQGFILIVK